MDDLGSYVTDDHLAIEPLRELGWDVETVSWRAENVDWSEFEAVIIRSPWDYHNEPERFLSVLQEIENSSALLVNPLDIVKWNLNKKYLAELEKKGVTIVLTVWGNELIDEEISASWFEKLDTDEVIIKPLVSATAKDTYRLKGFLPELKDIFHEREYMIQPFMKNIVDEGEYSLFFFDGNFSHAILKTPKQDDFRVQEDFGGSNKSIKPSEKLLRASKKALRAIGRELLYARIDLVRDQRDEFALMELELIEPALYFRMDAESPKRFAKTLDRWMNEL